MADLHAQEHTAEGPGRYPVDPVEVARALTLLQPPETIEVDVGGSGPLERPELEVLIQRVRRRHQVARLLAQIPFGPVKDGRPLGPGSGLSSDGAVLLALHLALSMPVDDIANALGLSEERAGIAMYEARERMIGRALNTCLPWRATLGRYADPGITRSEIAALLRHLSECEHCRQMLEEFRALDERILESREPAPVLSASRSFGTGAKIRRRSMILWTPILAVIALVIVGIAGIGFNTGGSNGPVPLLAATQSDSHRGWLVMSSESEVMAIDLQSGERRRILEGPNHDWWNPWILSPNGQLAVRWEERTQGGNQVGAIRAYDMTGDLRYLRRWEQPRSRIFSGWLDDRTVLFIERGAVQRAGLVATASESMLPVVLSVDLETGQEQEIYRGPVDKAVASPDGRHIALVQPASSRWPGKTIEVREVSPEGVGGILNIVEHRLPSWPGRIVWSGDSQTVYMSLVDSDEVPDALPAPTAEVPGPFEIEHLIIAGLGIDGSVSEYGGGQSDGWAVIQAIAPDNSSMAVVVNPAGDRDSPWYYGTYNADEDRFILSEHGPPGGHWWNSETVWLPDSNSRLVQQLTALQIDGPNPAAEIESLVLMEIAREGDLKPSIVFHDAMAIGERQGRGLALLRWVSDETMRVSRTLGFSSPQPGTPQHVSHANDNQQLFGDSEVAPTGRHILLQESYPEEGTLLRLMHMQAWSGTAPRLRDWGEFSWLPRESAAIGTTGIVGRTEQANRLVVLATDLNSPLHGRYLDPAGIARNTHLRYRRPAVSPNGVYTTFFVQDQREGTVSLWMGRWSERPRQVDEWEFPTRTRVDARLISKWISHDTLLFTTVTGWDDGYPQRISLNRAVVNGDGDLDVTELRDFRAGGRDDGIDLLEVAVSSDASNVAYRIRHYAGSDPTEDATDSIHISPASDLTQRVEILRADPGEGMIWAHEEDWLVVGIDERIALVDDTGRNLTYVTNEPSAFPVMVGTEEVWYQEMTRPWRIMRFPLYD